MFFSRKAGMQYVNRGDIGVEDFTKANLTANGGWHTLDLSGIIPLNAKLVCLHLYIKYTDYGSQMKINPYGYTLHYTDFTIKTLIANDSVRVNVTVPILSPGLIQYKADDVVWTDLEINVAGWWI